MSTALHTDKNLLEVSQADLAEDITILRSFISCATGKLFAFNKLLAIHTRHVPASVLRISKEQVGILRDQYTIIKKHVTMLSREIAFINGAESLAAATQKKDEIYNLLRSLQGILGSTLVMTDWQSPSFLYSLFSQAGIQTGKIIGTMNDYKRDQHLDAQSYEDLFRREYIDGLIKFPIAVYATNSGMAAFSTILMYLQSTNKINGPVIIGKSCYFEYKELVKTIVKKKIIEVDEMNTQQILDAVRTSEPSVVFFDSLCNSADMALPDLSTILSVLKKTVKRETYAVIDNTGLATTFQSLGHARGRLRIIVHESLNKYHQFGMDRVTAGIMYGYGLHVSGLFTMREHAGTNISDASVCALPSPDKKVLLLRLARLQRNATMLATHIQSLADAHPTGTVERVMYPGFPNHPSHAWTVTYPFTGSFFSVLFKPKFRNIRLYKRFVTRAIVEAKKRNIDIVSGTSFGLSTTRIYLTAIHTKYGEPFVRIAAGTEHILQIEQIKEVFNAILS